MGAPETELQKFLEDKIKKYEGVLVPVKASKMEQLLVKKVAPEKLHPNPDDEFCFPSIGPNYSIIHKYVRKFERFGTMTPTMDDEPLMVQKVHPDGYMILNGHHRWAAAMRVGFKTVPIQIVNLTQETDIKKMLAASVHDKRVTLDLDETVFCKSVDEASEKPLKFPYSKMYKEKIRLGLPSLLHYFGKQGYDVWVYSANYYSLDYLRSYFEHYSVKVDGIITGTSKRTGSTKKKTQKRIENKYNETLHIDRDLVLRFIKEPVGFEEYTVDPDSPSWAREVVRLVNGFSNNDVKD